MLSGSFRYGVRILPEWVSGCDRNMHPKLKTIEIYVFEKSEYKQNGVYKGCNSAVSQSFNGLEIRLEDIFPE